MFGKINSKSCNTAIAIVSGLLFSIGWWLFIDVLCVASTQGYGAGKVFEDIPGILVTIGMFLLLNLPDEMFVHDSYGGNEAECYQKVILAISIVLLLGGCIESIWQYSALPRYKAPNPKDVSNIGPFVIAQTVCITIASLLWRFLGTAEDTY